VSLESPQIVPIPDNPRAYRLVIPVKRDPVSASLYVDNRGTKSVGTLQAYLSVSANSVLSTGDQATIGFFTVPNQPKELLFGNASYTTTLNRSGTNITVTGSRFRARPGASFASLDLQFDSKSGGIRLSQPLLRQRDLGLWANLELEVRDVRETEAQSLVFSDKIRTLSGSIDYYRRHNGGESRASIEVTQGLPVLGASGTSAGALVSRPGADRDFTKANLFVSRYQDLGKVFGLYLAGTGQFSAKPLLTSENFSLGGPNFGRAYDYWEVSGQSGVAGTAEFRYGRNPGLKWLNFYQLYAFYDVGAVWNDTSGGESQRASLSSAGGGLRLTLFKKFRLSYEMAVPLARVPSARTSRAPRHFFSFSAQF
jgi:hemolysin activation/secretion protein